MKIMQISIFLENRKGRLHEVTSLLGNNKINIRALNIAETGDFGVMRLVVDKPQEALALLKSKNFVASTTDIVAIEVADKPGGLAEVLKTITDNNVNIEYMYGFVEKRSDQALLVFRFDNADNAVAALKQNGIKIVTESEIKSL
ncbi:MAG: amino acid-binding protein [Candidatus Raymondbacteria bacterium RifOxyA12_full_50_37]|uniref:Amino acid-binding protein n=1 Tax=Candidatus Raymondbacteria bacterium RIFOXYD12_FULL_49_13 TaxID=1817890 RepID=A0A1F7F582_UNCRA|nr:MAG: amino acid-binding protein [Candidatus Raymondbacteria bacterium RIFOXYA2_FULL_49_16]OGJ90113.1 MAG: amino acid-binding protein [Candidatus Raymondbacteria bacterium RifOxyA12_full_50_37]OGJ97691.1 MAG: amino acid-binding protein [Candidatus Raymondbacteria bacterium RIFOXYC2_FULL_50_21]OGK01742.1 MAG: amino acid-binding protein [Candidatus Raymondbacteria bacterium RIFOXYD12_FULL_49_13]OGP43648.1 MAG: amino acid-binding protein [Candidatus Raymondbacteria bacterium RIFOXYB2_FULL_49_35]